MSEVTNKEQAHLIEAQDLKKYFSIRGKGKLHAVDGISFYVDKGETLALVGESGCGKSTVGNLVMRLLDPTGGKILLNGSNIYETTGEASKLLFRKMQIIFQDPYSSLNPRKTIRSILREAYVVQKMGSAEEIDQKIMDLCTTVGISHDLLDHYPHELDGGMRQVVGIARALSLSPEFIVCDEPVSSLDVSVQAKIINLLMDLQKQLNLSYLFISHDLSVVRHISNRVAVMYLGQIVEIADVDDIFSNAMHPYTIALLSAVPNVDVTKKASRIILQGDVPSPINPKPGCRFAPRCWMAKPECSTLEPRLTEVAQGHCVACPFWAESREEMVNAAKRTISEQR